MDTNLIIGVLRGTPAWVFILFAYLLIVGVKQLMPGVRQVRSLWLAPAFFIAWGVVGLFGRAASPGEIVGHWLIGAVFGALLAMPLSMDLQADRSRGLVRQPASVVPLLRNLSIFFSHYLLRVAAAIHPGSAHQLMAWDIVVSGISVGYFVAWSIRFAQAYSRVPQTVLDHAAIGAQPAVR